MDYIDASVFERIYSGKGFWIGRRAAGNYESFYLLVSDQRAAAGMIAVRITKETANRIIASGGEPKLVDAAARDLGNGFLYVK